MKIDSGVKPLRFKSMPYHLNLSDLTPLTLDVGKEFLIYKMGIMAIPI